ncbi:hypothetical protein Srot_1171 [Segniliparus rotundus DSM 44985]|uniref:Uncharacterized protein n=1 Tax=Segniliparus rotundus (strain ATCC BAA-972 / CDC 1076 / CIP 108378 / DSM 44985 / JCM 13578) TaxID=640132 RepID=D6ZFB8_SEGRD|nr:hypothetical protein [Segniliparus rotundus]ADG97642.1 hypothetical protein Srot_1171 [Segniliparus rotundus DSM 44985]
MGSAEESFKHWRYETQLEDAGDYGLIQSVDAKTEDGKTLTVRLYEVGAGGLILAVIGDKGTRLTIKHDDGLVRHNYCDERDHYCDETVVAFED